MKRALCGLVVLAAGSAVAFAQQVISAKSGVIHVVEGRVLMGDQPILSKVGSFPEIKENATVATEAGRVEVLLTPGVFLRLGEDSSFRMITNRLIDTRLEILSGKAVIEADEIAKDTAVTVVVNGAAIRLLKKGLYRFEGSPAALRVFDGEASVELDGRTIEVNEGRMVALEGELAVTKFDKEATDALDRWSRRRGEYVALANVAAANSLSRSGNSWTRSGWAYNRYFGMFTFIPLRGTYISPYGYQFWSPSTVVHLYRPRPVMFPSGGGYGGFGLPSGSHSATGYSGAMSSGHSVSVPASHAPSTSAASAPSSPVTHSGGGGNAGGGAASRR